MAGVDPPTLGTGKARPVAERQCDDPADGPPCAVQQAGEHEDGRSRQLCPPEADDRAAKSRVATYERDVGDDMQCTYEEVGEAEDEGVLAESVGHCERRNQHRTHGGEQHHPDRAFVCCGGVAEPDVPAPGDPERDQDRDCLHQPFPGRVVVQEGRDLREREDEDEVEEELERRDPLLALDRSLQKLPSRQFVQHLAEPAITVRPDRSLR